MTKKTVRCAIYTRKSSEEGLEQDYNSLDAQRDACRAYIESHKAEGWVVHQGRFDDGGISGGTMERPALKRLLALVKAGDVDVIVVYKIDRLTRSLADFARIVEVLDAHDASFVSVTQQFNTTTSMGRLTLNVLLSFAQFEREVTSERIRDKIAASKKKGIWMGGRPPLGYDIVNRRLVPNLTEAETLTAIFEAALEARSLTRLEAIMAARGVCAKSWVTQNGGRAGGGALTRSALARILRNPIYIGKIHHGGRLYDGEHEPILTKALWDSVQTMLDQGAKERKNGENQSFYAPLRDLVFDDQGNRMVPTYNKKKNRIAYRYYVSLPLIRGASQETGTINRINAAYLERIVAQALHDDEKHDAEARLEQSFVDRIEKITLYKDEITIDLKARGNNLPQRLHIAAALKKPSHRKQVFMNGGKNNQNEGLIKAVAQAYGWRKALEAGVYPTVKELAVQKCLSERYVWKILRLAYLSPAIVEAVLDGCQPPGLSLHQINKTQLSPDWGSQSQALGFDFAR